MYICLCLHTVGFTITDSNDVPFWGGGVLKWVSDVLVRYVEESAVQQGSHTQRQTLSKYLQRSEVTEKYCLIPVKPKYTLIRIKRFGMC